MVLKTHESLRNLVFKDSILMNNSRQSKQSRWAEPKLKNPWQRFLFSLVVGLILGLMIQWTLTDFDPLVNSDWRPWRQALKEFMWKTASPETWFWMIFIFNFVLAVLNEIYCYYRS